MYLKSCQKDYLGLEVNCIFFQKLKFDILLLLFFLGTIDKDNGAAGILFLELSIGFTVRSIKSNWRMTSAKMLEQTLAGWTNIGHFLVIRGTNFTTTHRVGLCPEDEEPLCSPDVNVGPVGPIPYDVGPAS